MTFYDDMLAAMTTRLRADPGLFHSFVSYTAAPVSDDENVVAYKEDSVESGYCETCWYAEEIIEYTLENSAGEKRLVFEYADLGSLLRGLEHHSGEVQRDD